MNSHKILFRHLEGGGHVKDLVVVVRIMYLKVMGCDDKDSSSGYVSVYGTGFMILHVG
jgi:hypothetical protein